VKEYQELTPLSRIFARMAHTGVPYFPMGRQKKSGPQPFTKFSPFVGDTMADIMTDLRESDEGILRGEGGKKNF